MMPCMDGCAPDECHGREPGFHNGHARQQARTHDRQVIDYCIYCLARIRFLNNRWQTDIVVIEWP